ncbi:MAG TPA: hypothetical protein VLS48_04295, partial [Anaerolineales bacterium]|nr:hypothetical protein [Anaerolineales bacterium]
DFARALALALALVLAWLWFLRRTASRTAAWLGAVLVLLGSGARWLLLFLPGGLAARLDTTINLLGSAAQSGPDFSAVMVGAWQIEGSGPLPFPFAFANGLHHPLVIALNGSGALPYVGLLLLLLLGGRRLNWARGLLVGLLLAGLALSAEHIFGLGSAGLGLAVVRSGLALRKYRLFAPWVMALVFGGLLALAQGGVITELARGLVWGVDPASEASYGFHGFRWDWTPVVLSAHFGRLQLFSPLQLLAALAELGPALFLGGWVTLYFVRRPLFNRMVETGLGLGAAVIFGLALFLRYGVERDLSRLFGAALWVWLVSGWPLVWIWASRARPWGRVLAGGACGDRPPTAFLFCRPAGCTAQPFVLEPARTGCANL